MKKSTPVVYIFKGKLWKFQGPSAWYFFTVQKKVSQEIRKSYSSSEEGWGRLKAKVTLGKTTWKTAIWFNTKLNSYLLPVKKEIRTKEKILIGQIAPVKIEFDPPIEKHLREKKLSTPKSDPESWKTTEKALTENLHEDLLEAWEKIKAFSLSLGEQRMYASGKAIMFSKKTCFFFVRPKKSFLEVVIFLNDQTKISGFSTVKAVSKTKFAHTFKLIHGDQVEAPLTEAISDAYLK